MALLIDCYNVLHADPGANLTTDGLCRQLAGTHWTRFGITVVCDGQPKPLEIVNDYPGVEVVHSGPGRTADDVIIDQIEAEQNPRRLVVVSSDRQIRTAARRRRSNAWTSEEFLKKLAEEQRGPSGRGEASAKPGGAPLSEQQVDQWLRAFGLDRDDQADETEEDQGWPPW